MAAHQEIVGQRFGRLLVIAVDLESSARTRRVHCRCDCGNDSVHRVISLTRGKTRSCGCLLAEAREARRLARGTKRPEVGGALNGSFRHGMARTAQYKRWASMIDRCTNPNNPMYPHYGGRGITICERWRHDFMAFHEDMGPCPPGLSIDRIDVNGPYSPENCRWATDIEQHRNTRRTIMVEYLGQRMSLREACERSGVRYGAAVSRHRNGHAWNVPRRNPNPDCPIEGREG